MLTAKSSTLASVACAGSEQRNGRFFANLTVTDDLGRGTSSWVPLSGATLDEAKSHYTRLLTERNDDRLRPTGLASQASADLLQWRQCLVSDDGLSDTPEH